MPAADKAVRDACGRRGTWRDGSPSRVHRRGRCSRPRTAATASSTAWSSAAPDDSLVGAELVGWLMETRRRSVIGLRRMATRVARRARPIAAPRAPHHRDVDHAPPPHSRRTHSSADPLTGPRRHEPQRFVVGAARSHRSTPYPRRHAAAAARRPAPADPAASSVSSASSGRRHPRAEARGGPAPAAPLDGAEDVHAASDPGAGATGGAVAVAPPCPAPLVAMPPSSGMSTQNRVPGSRSPRRPRAEAPSASWER